MNLLFAAAPNPFDVKAALLAGHAQHPVIVHFPIALFIASAVFDVLAIWRKQPLLAVVAYFNLVGAAIAVPLAIATGLGAWRWQLEGARLKGNLELHRTANPRPPYLSLSDGHSPGNALPQLIRPS